MGKRMVKKVYVKRLMIKSARRISKGPIRYTNPSRAQFKPSKKASQSRRWDTENRILPKANTRRCCCCFVSIILGMDDSGLLPGGI
jgi:hypothetical protein